MEPRRAIVNAESVITVLPVLATPRHDMSSGGGEAESTQLFSIVRYDPVCVLEYATSLRLGTLSLSGSSIGERW